MFRFLLIVLTIFFLLPLTKNCSAQMPIFISKSADKFATTVKVGVVTEGDIMTATYS